MQIELKKNAKIRLIELKVDQEGVRRHFEVLNELLKKGCKTHRVGNLDPNPEKPAHQWVILGIDEDYADEYLAAVAPVDEHQ